MKLAIWPEPATRMKKERSSLAVGVNEPACCHCCHYSVRSVERSSGRAVRQANANAKLRASKALQAPAARSVASLSKVMLFTTVVWRALRYRLIYHLHLWNSRSEHLDYPFFTMGSSGEVSIIDHSRLANDSQSMDFVST